MPSSSNTSNYEKTNVPYSIKLLEEQVDKPYVKVHSLDAEVPEQEDTTSYEFYLKEFLEEFEARVSNAIGA